MHMHQRMSLVLMSFAVAGAAWAHPEYKVTIVGPAGSTATDINEAGVVVGNYPVGAGITHAFLNRGRGLVDLGTLKGTSSTATAINDRGQVLGQWTTRSGQVRGYIYDKGKLRDIGTIGGRYTTWTDINNAGYISVFAADPVLPDGEGGGSTSYLRAPNGALTQLADLPFTNPLYPPLTEARALNNKNQVTGGSGPAEPIDFFLRGFIWTRGQTRDIGDLGYPAPINPVAINDRGQVTGNAELPGGPARAAFLYYRGRIVSIDSRPASEGPFSGGTGINNRGHVVGFSIEQGGARAFIWRGRRMEFLNALIDPRQGWSITDAQAINDAGQIAATGTRNGETYAVRLDLIRPYANAVPAAEPDEEASVEPALSTEAAAARAKAEAEAAAREVAQPVTQ
ncbi:HAF repeat-containing protein [Massilia sp.]|uniref:HAF repeat-containing protein n=1 Tax=Massilia sp. TaxID=1882437 RepID=UPI00289F0F96|nr:HAF repeat-containing protein [Massilia sp.]